MPDLSSGRKKINPYTHVTFHKDYVHDKIKYLVLAVDQMPKDVVEMVRAKIKSVTSGPEVSRMVWGSENGKDQGWMYVLEHDGRIGRLTFRGTEVALYYKRQVSEILPGPGEPLPEHRLSEPDDVWVRVDLIGSSARKANVVLKSMHTSITAASKVKDQMLAVKEGRIGVLETQVLNLTTELANQKKYTETLGTHNALFRKTIGYERAKKLLESHKREQERQQKAKARREMQIARQQAETKAKEAKKQVQKDKKLKKKGKPQWTPADMRAKTPQRQAALKAKSKGRK